MPNQGSQLGQSVIRLDDVGGGWRVWTASIYSADGSTHITSPLEPGGTYKVIVGWASFGTPPFAQATDYSLAFRLHDSEANVGSQVNGSITGNSGNVEHIIHVDNNPLDGSLGTANSGTLEIWLQVRNLSYEVDSRGGSTTPPATATHNWQRGFMRSWVKLTASPSLSNVSLGGATPAQWAYPDPLFSRVILEGFNWRAVQYRLQVLSPGGAVRISALDSSSIGNTRDHSLTGNLGFDGKFSDVGDHTVKLIAPLNTSPLPDFFGNSFYEYVFDTLDVPSGWTPNGDFNNCREMVVTAPQPVDTRVTISNLTIDAPWTTATVHNRNDRVDGTLDRVNARGEAFIPIGADRLRSINVATNAVEQTLPTPTRSGATMDWVLTFSVSSNVAPADQVGAAKKLRYEDTGAGAQPALTDEPTFGFLSSLYNVLLHLQMNDNALDPALHTTQRLTSDLGFYSIGIENQRGEGIDGASVTDHLRDDGDLVDVIDRTAVTATVNGHAGYLSLKAWDSSLPGGGWDHWVDAGSFQGNSYEKARSGVGTADYTLLSKDPNLVVVSGAGVSTAAADGDHWHPGEDLLVGLALFDLSTSTTVAVDLDDSSNPRAYVILARFNVTLGRAEYLELDETTWSAVTGGTTVLHQLVASPGDAQAYVKTIVGANSANWGGGDLFVVGIAYRNSTPYGLFATTGVLSASNAHDGYALDGLGLALHGILSQR